MTLKYQFNEFYLAHVRGFFQVDLGLKLVDPKYTGQSAASGSGRLMHAEIDVENLDALLEQIQSRGKMREWSQIHGTLVD